MNYGGIYKKLRQARAITMDDLAGGIISKSQISRFESNDSEISFTKLLYLVNSLNMTIDEFFTHCNGFQQPDLIAQIKEFQASYQKQDKQALLEHYQRISQTLHSNSPVENRQTEQVRLLLKSYLSKIDQSFFPTDEEILSVNKYLQSVTNWGYYECYLLNSFNHFIPYQDLLTLTQNILEQNQFYKHLPENQHLISKIILNTMMIAIQEDDVDTAKVMSQHLRTLVRPEDYLIKNAHLYNQGWLDYRTKQMVLGLNKMQQALFIFKVLDEDGYFKHFSQHFKEITQSDPVL
ncbi:helix-turn-helix domain-containing protein [Streptococcus plurextorum]|uniref:helix-turn-helix domain-containing protein n=1 Tax=Streptococcus plurextorum TaxID=456876 RepID=UPI00041B4C36|nr:Rgg/GadR/MutR family transcriptional regulator [Streptococcus plurextorum]